MTSKKAFLYINNLNKKQKEKLEKAVDLNEIIQQNQLDCSVEEFIATYQKVYSHRWLLFMNKPSK